MTMTTLMFTAEKRLWILRRYAGSNGIEEIGQGQQYPQINYDGGELVAEFDTREKVVRASELLNEIKALEEYLG